MKRALLALIAMGFCLATYAQTAIEKGKAVYEANCLVCHQVDGTGVPMMNPPLTNSALAAGEKKDVITVLLKGLSDQKVNGQSYSNPMPALDYLSDEDIANVLTYVRNNFGNSAPAVSEADVKQVRAGLK